MTRNNLDKVLYKIGDKQTKHIRFVGDWVSQHETTHTNMGRSSVVLPR